ncbi:MAG: hypothetical protein ACT4NV_08710 [Rhodoferax sp.]
MPSTAASRKTPWLVVELLPPPPPPPQAAKVAMANTDNTARAFSIDFIFSPDSLDMVFWGRLAQGISSVKPAKHKP